jgi:hypothetical protein
LKNVMVPVQETNERTVGFPASTLMPSQTSRETPPFVRTAFRLVFSGVRCRFWGPDSREENGGQQEGQSVEQDGEGSSEDLREPARETGTWDLGRRAAHLQLAVAIYQLPGSQQRRQVGAVGHVEEQGHGPD